MSGEGLTSTMAASRASAEENRRRLLSSRVAHERFETYWSPFALKLRAGNPTRRLKCRTHSAPSRLSRPPCA